MDESPSNSRTWSNHLKYLCNMYGLSHPSMCLERKAPSKIEFKNFYNSRITSFHEKEMRSKSNNLLYLNISLLGLNNRPHPALCGAFISRDIEHMRPHLKMLCQDYTTYETQSECGQAVPLHVDCANTPVTTRIHSQTTYR